MKPLAFLLSGSAAACLLGLAVGLLPPTPPILAACIALGVASGVTMIPTRTRPK